MDIKNPGKSVPNDDRTGKPVETSRSDYIQKDYGRSWSSQGVEKWSCRARSIGET